MLRKRRRRSPEELKAAIENRSTCRAIKRSAFIDLNWLPATSCQVERLFSLLKCKIGYLRKSMSAELLEVIVYLRLNWDLVTDEVVSSAVRSARLDCDDDDFEC